MNSKNILSVKIIIADDHQFFRDGLSIALKRLGGVKKISHAVNGKEVLNILSKEMHDIVFMDVKMPIMNGIEATKYIRKSYPHVKVIALSMYDDQKNVLDMLNNGACGYIIKNTDRDEIEKAIDAVMSDKSYFSSSVSSELFQKLLYKQKQRTSPDRIEFLTEREESILHLICKQHTSQEIGDMLFISDKTVEVHRRDLLKKTKSKNVAGLVLWAIKNGYYDDV